MLYTEPRPGPVRNGTPGGDNQISDAWNRRFVCLDPLVATGDSPRLPLSVKAGQRLYRVIDVDVYVTTAYGDEKRVILERQDEYSLRADSPDGPEVWADNRYTEIPCSGKPTDTTALDACKAVKPTEFTWDGQPQSIS